MQGLSVFARLLYGFLCVRILSISDYAKFAIVSGFVGTICILMDINMSGTLAPLVGSEINRPQTIADYVASLRGVVHLLFLVVGGVVAMAFPFIVRNQHWGWKCTFMMLSLLLATCWFVRMSGAYGAALILCRNRKAWYRAQVFSGICSVVVLCVFYLLRIANAYWAIVISLSASVYVALAYYYHAQKTLGVVGVSTGEKQKEIVHLALPNMPNALFYAFQGQIALLMITIFGHVGSVAGVGALGRLAQIFVFFGQMNFLLLEPYFASMPQERFKRSYAVILLAQAAICLVAVSVAYYVPQAFLWILGDKYSGLRREAFLVIASGAISYFSGVLWGIHTARKFVYWWNSSAYIVITLFAQAWFISHIDLSSIYSVLLLNIVSASIALILNLSAGIYGMLYGPRCEVSDAVESARA